MIEKYPTKNSKIRECRAIINRAQAHGAVNNSDSLFLTELLRNHKHHQVKIGCGIESFFVAKTMWGNYGLFLKRIDGSETDFSFLECINPTSHLQEIKKACRTAIYKEMQASKQGKDIAHHVGATFDGIFKQWIEGKNIDNIRVNESSDNCVTTFFVDDAVAKDFLDFHNSIAVIKGMSTDEHRILHSIEGIKQ